MVTKKVFLAAALLAGSKLGAASAPKFDACELHALLSKHIPDGQWLSYALAARPTMPVLPVLEFDNIGVGSVVSVYNRENGLPDTAVLISIDETEAVFSLLEMNPRFAKTGSPYDPKARLIRLPVTAKINGSVIGSLDIPSQASPAAVAQNSTDYDSGALTAVLRNTQIEYPRTTALNVGEVVSSPAFALAVKEVIPATSVAAEHLLVMDSHLFSASGLNQQGRVERRALMGVGGGKPSIDLTAFDASRGRAPFLIIARDHSPASLLTAIRLTPEGDIRVPFELLKFSYQSSYSHSINGIVRWGSLFSSAPVLTAQ